jgi:hypothetical protein
MVAARGVLSQLQSLLEGTVEASVSRGRRGHGDVLWYNRQDRHISNPQRIDTKDAQVMVNARLCVTRRAHLHRAGHVPGG